MLIRKYPDHSSFTLFKRTISAQIHFLGLMLAGAGWVVLCGLAAKNPDAKHFWACFTFGLTSILVFGSSTLYHFLGDGFKISPWLDKLLETLDHFAIYLFIAGTYTPVLLNAIAEPWANLLLVGIWGIAIFGVLYTYFKPRLPNWAKHRFVYTGIFLVMGWLAIFRVKELVENLSPFGLIFLVAGGLSYSIGAVIYATKRPQLFVGIFGFHELWHIMVLLGYGFHYFVILNFYWN